MLLPAQSNAGVQFCPKVEEVLRLSSCPGNGEGLAGLRHAMDGRAALGVDVDVVLLAGWPRSKAHWCQQSTWFILGGSLGLEVNMRCWQGRTVPFILHKGCVAEGCGPGRCGLEMPHSCRGFNY